MDVLKFRQQIRLIGFYNQSKNFGELKVILEVLIKDGLKR